MAETASARTVGSVPASTENASSRLSAANEPRGEYVLVMAGAPASTEPEAEMTLEQAAQRALELTGQGFGPTAAAKAAAQGTPYSKSEVYKALLTIQQRDPE